MLKFHGIRFNQQGTPERFTVSFALKESLNAALYICEYFKGDREKALEAINEEINKLFRVPTGGKKTKNFRFLVAKWFRAKDIVQFFYTDSSTVGLKLKIAGIVNKPETIVDKWRLIEPVLLNYVLRLSVEERNALLSDGESDLNLILRMVALFFLEQDDEVPPANLELQFVRHQFPKIIWKKKDGFNASSNPFWITKNLYCRPSYLTALIITKTRENPPQLTLKLDKPEKSLTIDISDTRFPVETPAEIRLELDSGESGNYQLSLIPETVFETLLSLQRIIQKSFSHDGVKHFLGILRQLSVKKTGSMSGFKVSEHLELVAKPTREGKHSQKQVSLFEGVYKILLRIKVNRFWKTGNQEKQISNPFVLEISNEKSSEGEIRQLLLDPLFLAGPENPFRLGSHLTLISGRLFRESVYKHALLPGLSSFITGTWLNEFSRNNGVAEKTTREILEGCAFNLTAASQYKIIRKLEAELVYMKKKSYIAGYKLTKDRESNPWNDVHQIIAPDRVVQSIVENARLTNANSMSEKLIA